MLRTRKNYFFIFVFLFAVIIFSVKRSTSPEVSLLPTAVINIAPSVTPTLTPENIFFEDNPLKDSIISAGDYLMRQQLANGELSYQVNIMTGERSYTPAHTRLMEGAGVLFTVCRVSGDLKYCNAGDLALNHYSAFLINDTKKFKGTCLYTEGTCQLGGAALTVDVIYKRWQATNGFFLKENNLLNTAANLGYFIVSLRKPGGGFYHAYDPYYGGTADPNFFAAYSASESPSALIELYEMTGNEF